jgi:hypothetical protein
LTNDGCHLCSGVGHFRTRKRLGASGTSLGDFTAGQSVDFVPLLGHGVSDFDVIGISPLVDPSNTSAFGWPSATPTPASK